MATEVATKEDVIRSLDGLPAESLAEVRRFVEFLQFKTRPRPLALSAEQIHERLMASFGMWADRTDLPADSIDYVDEIRRGHRLDDFGLRTDETH
jgi:hypothetical protein